MPYLSFDLDAMDRVGDVGRLAGISEAEVAWGLLRLWRLCWKTRRAVVSVSELAGVFGGDGERVLRGLETFGFAERVETGVRVRGVARYLRITEAQSKAGKRASGNLRQNRGRPPALRAGGEPVEEPVETSGSSPALSSIIDHRSSNKEEESTPLSLSATARASSAAEFALENTTPPPPDPVFEVFEHWKTVMEHPRAKLDPKRTRAIKARLSEGRTVADLKQAIDGCAVTPFNRGENDRGQRFDDLELICRNGSQVDRFMANAEHPPNGRPPDPTKGFWNESDFSHVNDPNHDPSKDPF